MHGEDLCRHCIVVESNFNEWIRMPGEWLFGATRGSTSETGRDSNDLVVESGHSYTLDRLRSSNKRS